MNSNRKQIIRTISLLLLFSAALGCRETPKTIEGKVDLTPELQKTLSGSAVLYVIARPEGETSGPPVAVKRFVQPLTFPMPFSMSQNDAMIPDAEFKGKFNLSARIAQSGSATPVRAGDIEGRAASNPVAVGQSGVVISLTDVKQEPKETKGR